MHAQGEAPAPVAAPPAPPPTAVPVTILSGFPGSGKTSLLKGLTASMPSSSLGIVAVSSGTCSGTSALQGEPPAGPSRWRTAGVRGVVQAVQEAAAEVSSCSAHRAHVVVRLPGALGHLAWASTLGLLASLVAAAAERL